MDNSEHIEAEKELKRQRKSLRNIMATIPDSMLILDRELRIKSANRSFYKLFQTEPEKIIGKEIADILGDEGGKLSAELTRLFGTRKTLRNFELCHQSEKLGERIFDVTARGMIVAGEKEDVVVIQDITERKWAENALTESEQRYRALFESTLDGAFVIDAETMKVVLANEAAASIFGFDSAEDVVGVSPLDFVPLGDRERVVRIIAEDMFARDLRQVNEFRTITRDGREIWIRAVGVRTEYQGRLAGLVSFWDITERKQAEEALKEAREYAESIVATVREPLVVLDADLCVVSANRSFYHTFQVSPEETKGQFFYDLGNRQWDIPELRQLLGEILPKHTSVENFEVEHDFPVIGHRVMLVSARQIYREPDLPHLILVAIEDITEYRRAQQEQLKLEKLESIGVLAGGIAHDFNNILTGILGNITLAERYIEPGGKAAERLLEARKASLRAKDLTQQLLTFSKGGTPIKKIASIAELLQESATFALRGSNVRCEFSLPDDLWPVEVDEGQMTQVITNIVINADEAMPEGGIIGIRAKNTTIKKKGTLPLPKGNYVEIIIEDHGVGIAKEHLGRIFEPYFTTKRKGSGLGLATAYSIIKNHDGYITVDSELGIGTTFHIYLPASKGPAPAKKEVAEEVPVRGQGKILVMDDEETIREMLGRMLSLAGYDVELSKDGAEAVALYREAKESGQPFDAVILDLTVPGGVGGKEAIKKLLEINPKVKAIVSSGYSTDPIMADFKKYGFSAVVTKPFSVDEMERTLHQILSERKRRAG